MSNWDDDDFEVPAPVIASKGKWEGEDEDEDDIPVPPPSFYSGIETNDRMNGMPSQKMRSRNPQQ